jgi:hypothetical protein
VTVSQLSVIPREPPGSTLKNSCLNPLHLPKPTNKNGGMFLEDSHTDPADTPRGSLGGMEFKTTLFRKSVLSSIVNNSNRAMAPLTTTRTLFELRVGSTHTIEVLLQIRLADISWWNSDLYNHERQLYKLIGRRVLPDECREEIEADRARAREAVDHAKRKKRERGGGGGEGMIGEANSKKRAAENQKSAANRRKRGGTSKEKSSKKNSKDGNGNNALASESKEKKLKFFRGAGTWVMGSSIQLCKCHRVSYLTTVMFFRYT